MHLSFLLHIGVMASSDVNAPPHTPLTVNGVQDALDLTINELLITVFALRKDPARESSSS